MKPLKKKISITLDEDILEKVHQLADEDDRSVSQYISQVLRRHLEKKEK